MGSRAILTASEAFPLAGSRLRGSEGTAPEAIHAVPPTAASTHGTGNTIGYAVGSAARESHPGGLSQESWLASMVPGRREGEGEEGLEAPEKLLRALWYREEREGKVSWLPTPPPFELWL